MQQQALILAGGRGERLRPLTLIEPKPLIRIGAYPFLEYVIRLLKRSGIQDIVISTGYLGSQIKKYFQNGSYFGVNIEYSHENYPLGTGGALKLAEKFLESNFFLLNGDTYLDIDYQEVYRQYKMSNRLGMMVVRLCEKPNCVINEKFDLIQYQKKGIFQGYVDAGVWVLNKKILKLIPPDRKVSLENEVLPYLVKKREIKVFPTKKKFYDIGTFEGLEQFREYAKRKLI